MFYIGCHLSASDGFLAMGKTALSIGANTFQFFTRNPRGSRAKPIDPADVAAFLTLAADNGFGTLVAHAPYTINPCSKDEHTREFARMTLADDLLRMEHVPGNVYNFHPGSHTGQGVETGITQIAETLKMDPLELRLKNSAKPGGKTVYGATLGQVTFHETVSAIRNHPHYSAPLDKAPRPGVVRGRGVASGFWFNAGGESKISSSNCFSNSSINWLNRMESSISTGLGGTGPVGR